MKIRNQDRDYISNEIIKKFANENKLVNHNSTYTTTVKNFYHDENGILQKKFVVRDSYECLEDGLVKCLRCYSLMIPYIDNGYIIFFNKHDGRHHYRYVKKSNKFQDRYKKREYGQWVCIIDNEKKQ